MLAENSSLCNANWPTLCGCVLPEGYEVTEMLRADTQTATFRVRVLGDWSARVYATIFCSNQQKSAEQVALWLTAKQLKYPSVNSPLAAGEVDHDGARLAYFIAPAPDESLASVLQDRPLTKDEALEILRSIRSALKYLHSQGWVHGHLSPEQVLAIGDSIQISSACAGRINTERPTEWIKAEYVAPEGTENLTPAADIWCLGATIFEALTQQRYSPDRFGEVAALQAPFDKTLERCLDPDPGTRCTLEELADLAANRLAPRPAPLPEARLAQIPPPESSVRRAEPVLTRVERRERHQGRSSKLWIYPVVAAIFVLLLLWAARPRHQYKPVTANSANLASNRPQQLPPTSTGGVTKTLPAAVPTNVPPAKTAGVSGHSEPRTVNGPIWRLIVFTYSHEADAEKKAHLLNERHHGINASVFAPNAHGGPYLVTVGGKMTQEEAARLRQRVIRLGLPRDSYIQNYRQ